MPAINRRSSTAKGRPADTTAYASGDLIADNTTAGSVTPHQVSVGQGQGKIKRIGVQRSGTNPIANLTVRVHLFNGTPGAVTNGDNGALVFPVDNYIGNSGDITMILGTNGAIGWSAVLDLIYKPAAGQGTVYALLEARGAYTPASAETFAVHAEVEKG